MTTAGPKAVCELIALAGGRLVGRTKLQKSACILELVGVGYGFPFGYRHFGPYSEELKLACSDADALGYIEEQTEIAAWGGWYSVFLAKNAVPIENATQNLRSEILGVTASADPVELELAVTAAFLAANRSVDAWKELVVRKPTKATPERVEAAKDLYKKLASIRTPKELPAIA